MSKKSLTPILVILKKGKHKTQPWTYTIDKPGGGPAVTVKERYAARRSAYRGALRHLGLWAPEGFPNSGPYFVGKTPVKFVTI
jgi:hypothetical protein